MQHRIIQAIVILGLGLTLGIGAAAHADSHSQQKADSKQRATHSDDKKREKADVPDQVQRPPAAAKSRHDTAKAAINNVRMHDEPDADPASAEAVEVSKALATSRDEASANHDTLKAIIQEPKAASGEESSGELGQESPGADSSAEDDNPKTNSNGRQ